MIRKLDWLKSKLKSPGYEDLAALTEAARTMIVKNEKVYPFRWVYKGKTSFRKGGSEAKKLALKGMGLPERSIQVDVEPCP